MRSVDIDDNSRLVVSLDGQADAAAFKASQIASDGADLVEVPTDGGTIHLDPNNPFNTVALCSTEFVWSGDAARVALNEMIPLVRSALHLHPRSHQDLMDRSMRKRFGSFGPTTWPPGKESDEGRF